MEHYTYEAFPNTESMRLLYVQPVVDGQNDIYCSLRVFPMGRDHEYNALSYSWGMDGNGDASNCERIIVDGKALGVTRNLFDGLRRIFARQERHLPIWIDAVCIDQSNIKERNSQVAQMGQIYANATTVVCWLGNGESKIESDDIATLVECFSTTDHSHFREHSVASTNGSVSYVCLAHAVLCAFQAIENAKAEQAIPSCIMDLIDASEVRAVWKEVHGLLEALLRKRYWSRTWIVQEICQARSPIAILWADHKITEQQLQAVLSHLDNINAMGNWMPFAYQDGWATYELHTVQTRIEGLFDLRKGFLRPPQDNMLSFAVDKCYDFECSDARDKVYGMLSFDERTSIQPDYALTTDRVYLAFSVDVLRRNKDWLTSVLHWASITRAIGLRNDDIGAALPSWCMDPRKGISLHTPGTTIGDVKVDSAGLLTCSALVVGVLSSDLAIVQPLATAVPADELGGREPNAVSVETNIKPYHWEDLDAARYSPGDLVCIFADIDAEIRAGRGEEGIVLRPLRRTEGRTIYKVANNLRFQVLAWTPGTHSVQTVCIA